MSNLLSFYDFLKVGGSRHSWHLEKEFLKKHKGEFKGQHHTLDDWCNLLYLIKHLDLGYEVRYTSDESWYPSFPGNTVLISPVRKLSDGKFRVCCWGADDFGLEIDLPTREEAEKIRNSLPEVISQDALYALGFVRA